MAFPSPIPPTAISRHHRPLKSRRESQPASPPFLSFQANFRAAVFPPPANHPRRRPVVIRQESHAGKATGISRSPMPRLTLLSGCPKPDANTDFGYGGGIADAAVHHHAGPVILLSQLASWSPNSAQRIEPPPSTTSTRPSPGSSSGANQGIILKHLQGHDGTAKHHLATVIAENRSAICRRSVPIAQVGRLKSMGATLAAWGQES